MYRTSAKPAPSAYRARRYPLRARARLYRLRLRLRTRWGLGDLSRAWYVGPNELQLYLRNIPWPHTKHPECQEVLRQCGSGDVQGKRTFAPLDLYGPRGMHW